MVLELEHFYIAAGTLCPPLVVIGLRKCSFILRENCLEVLQPPKFEALLTAVANIHGQTQ